MNMLKRCPVCGALSYSDTQICFECMHEFGEPYAEGDYKDIVNSLSWEKDEPVPAYEANFARSEIAASLEAAQSLRSEKLLLEQSDSEDSQDNLEEQANQSAVEPGDGPNSQEDEVTELQQGEYAETCSPQKDVAQGHVVVKTKSAPEGALEIVITLNKAPDVTF